MCVCVCGGRQQLPSGWLIEPKSTHMQTNKHIQTHRSLYSLEAQIAHTQTYIFTHAKIYRHLWKTCAPFSHNNYFVHLLFFSVNFSSFFLVFFHVIPALLCFHSLWLFVCKLHLALRCWWCGAGLLFYAFASRLSLAFVRRFNLLKLFVHQHSYSSSQSYAASSVSASPS